VPGQDPIRVVVVDDSEVVRLKLHQLLDGAEDIDHLGAAADGEAGIALAARLRPDVVIMDLKMPGMTGIEATWQLGTASPDSHVLVLTVSEDVEDVTGAIIAGATGYVVKGASDEELLDAIHRVAEGRRALSPAVAGDLIERVDAGPKPLRPAPAPGRAAGTA
jgi:DNA-binding NarL/FixJ family response regulator